MIQSRSLLVFFLAASALAGEKEAVRPVTLTFYVAGVECGACSELIHQSVQKISAVSDYSPYEFGIVNISFDASVVAAPQIARAISEAFPAHGKPYEATLHFRVCDYAKSGNAARVDAVLAKHGDRARYELLDKAKGEFAIHFLPSETDASRPSSPEWSLSLLEHAIRDVAPKGLGLDFELVRVGQER